MFIGPVLREILKLRRSDIGFTPLRDTLRPSGAKNAFWQHEL
jgi:hypothetical protein